MNEVAPDSYWANVPPAERPAPGEEVAPGVMLKAAKGRVVLSGKGVDAALQEALRGWLAAR